MTDSQPSRRRASVLAAALTAALAVGAVGGLTAVGAGEDPGNTAAASEEIVVDGVDVYRSELSDGGPTVYSFDPPTQADLAGAERLPDGQVGVGEATTGDLAACELLVKEPGSVTKGCAMKLAQVQYGDLVPVEGAPQVVYAVCGREPAPGEYVACGTDLVPEAEITDALRRLRAALEQER